MVSVVIPTFNRSDLLTEAINSVQDQSYPNTELIIVDDGSTDGTRERFKNHRGIVYLYQKNAGPSAARNKGIKHATGEYLAFLDSDDRWKCEFLSECVHELESTGASLAFASWNEIDQNDVITKENALSEIDDLMTLISNERDRWHRTSSKSIRELFILKTLAPTSGLLFRRKSYQHLWDESISRGEDQLYVLEGLFAADFDVVFTCRVLWTYLFHDSNFCTNNPDTIRVSRGEIQIKQRLLNHYAAALSPQQCASLRQSLSGSYFDLGYHLLQQNHKAQALNAFQASWKLRRSIKTLKHLVKSKFFTR